MKTISLLVRLGTLVVAGSSIAFGTALIAAGPLNNFGPAPVLYALLSAGAGAALIAAGLTNRYRSRTAWTTIGAGVLCWGIGEVVWILQSTAGEIPYPGFADFFYVAGYPLIFSGAILLPHLRPGRFERIRLAIDAVAGTVSLAAVMWVIYLSRVVSLGSDPVETFLNLLYPFGDVLLATALMVLAMRRSEQRLDLRIVFLAAAVALTTVADVVFSLQVAADSYVEWDWLDGLWLLSYGFVAVSAWLVTRPQRTAAHTYRAVRGWQLLAPYIAVATLFALRLGTSGGNDLLLNIATTAVAALIMGRQAISLRERRELLERQRDDLVASVSHELRTPLTGIQGYAQLLLEADGMLGPGERREMVETICVQASHLGRIVNDLIDVARDQLQNVNLNLTEYNAARLVREAVASAAAGKAVSLDLEEGLMVNVDPDRIRQVLVNLLTNALRYGRSATTVVVRRIGDIVSFAVHDDGDGVPAQYQHAIFERFERGAHRFDSAVAGSGIGLSVGRGLVVAHGGELRYSSSELLGGACFEFTVPLNASAKPVLVAAQ